jgi:hypothetical protein
MHPEKSKVVYCKDSNRTASYPHVSFTFLGFTFRPRVAINRQKRAFTNFLPGESADALKRMRKEVRGWRIHRQTPGTLVDLAQRYNPKIRGWGTYFGAFYRTAMRGLSQSIGQKLELWARRKYKTLSRNKQPSAGWLRKMKNETPGCSPTGVSLGTRLGNGSRVNREVYARFCGEAQGEIPWAYSPIPGGGEAEPGHHVGP